MNVYSDYDTVRARFGDKRVFRILIVGSEKMMIEEQKILDVLTASGAKVADYFILEGLPCALSDQFDCIANVIEDDSLANACVLYLRKHGAREFESVAQMEKYFGKKSKEE